MRLSSRVRERIRTTQLVARLPATQIVKLGQQLSLANGGNRSAERIETKFGLCLQTTGVQWPAKFERNPSSRFKTADDARYPLPANLYLLDFDAIRH